MTTTTASPEVLEILRASTLDGKLLRLPPQKLERKTYQEVNRVIEAAGGRWNRKAGAHLFEVEATAALASLLESGTTSRQRGLLRDAEYFPTPAPVVARIFELADVRSGMAVLEPSAGRGAIALALPHLETLHLCCYELLAVNAQILEEELAMRMPEGHAHDWEVHIGDFLEVAPREGFDRVVMNPPFSKNADIRHVSHALGFLRPGGLLVSVMSAGVIFRENRVTTTFRRRIESMGGRFEPLPVDSFKESGTGVSTCLLTVGSAS